MDFQSETFASFRPLNDDRSCFVCRDASCQILAYSTSMQIHTAENSGVTIPAMYHGGRISSNSHSWAVSQLFQNIGTTPIVTPITHPILITISATRRVMYLMCSLKFKFESCKNNTIYSLPNIMQRINYCNVSINSDSDQIPYGNSAGNNDDKEAHQTPCVKAAQCCSAHVECQVIRQCRADQNVRNCQRQNKQVRCKATNTSTQTDSKYC